MQGIRFLGGAVAITALVIGVGCTPPAADSGKPVAQVKVFPSAASVEVGKTIQFTAETYDADGRELAERFVTWHAVSNLVSISENGLVTGVAAGGPVLIYAISEGVTGTAQLTVSPVAVASVTVSGAATVKQNYSAQMTAVAKDASGNVLDRQFTWSSNDPSRASVSATGLVNGVSTGGPVTITATAEGKNGTAQITVVPNPVASVSLDPSAIGNMSITETREITATLRDDAGLTLTGRTITWSSNNSSIVSVAQSGPQSGQVTAVAEGGPVTITATSEGKIGTAQVTVTPLANAARLAGVVIDFTTGLAIPGATVIFQINNANFATVTAGADGKFTSPGLPAAPNGIWILANKTGYQQSEILVPQPLAGFTTNTEPIPLVPSSSTKGAISGTVRDSRTGLPIPNADLALSSWLTPTPVNTITNSSGVYTFTNLFAGTYQVTASGTGYRPSTRTGVAVGNGAVTANQDLVLTTAGSTDVRIVLTWGSQPRDLDSHLTGPTTGTARFHVYYGSRGSFTSTPFAGLDVDDTDGGGPETVTITQLVGGNYRFSVHDFSNRNSTSSTALGLSGARVALYLPNGQSRAFFVPTQPGTLWTVFELQGTVTNPVVVDRSEMSFTSDAGGILSPPAAVRGATDLDLIKRAMRLSPKDRPRN
jgi:uncharacterized protein YjdB